MKKIILKFYRHLILTGLLLTTSSVIYAQSTTAVRFEAESGTLSGGAQSSGDDTASGGSYLQFIGTPPSTSQWAFEETFNGNPTTPSQALLPKTLDYIATHRSHPGNTPGTWGDYPADHSAHDCAGPPLQHTVSGTSHTSNMANPDKSFFICRDHMMSSMGDVEGYSVTSFFPKQEFDFASNNGIIEFDANINYNNGRSWFEVMISPRDQIKFGAAEDWLPIDETYPRDRIVFSWSPWEQTRMIKVGTRDIAPDGWTARTSDYRQWRRDIAPNDPANTDRAIRRKNRILISDNKITWQIQKQDGTFDSVDLDVPGGLPFDRGIVMFKTHAYTPEKDGNMNLYTYHWDNIRFNGPKLPNYTNYEISEVVNLQGNGSVPIGSTRTQTLDLPRMGSNQVLMAQVQQLQRGQTLLSINGGPNIDMSRYGEVGSCQAGGWTTVYLPLSAGVLRTGSNTFKWTVGPRNSCMESWQWDGFAVKAFEIQQNE